MRVQSGVVDLEARKGVRELMMMNLKARVLVGLRS